MLSPKAVAGEVKMVAEEIFEFYLETNQWDECPCCNGLFSRVKSRQGKEKQGFGDCNWVAWILRMPITRSGAKYCSDYCRLLHNRHDRKKAKGSSAVRLLNDPFMERVKAFSLVDDLDLELKSTAKDKLPDYEHIHIPYTLAFKFYQGLWRVCGNRECCKRSYIYYTERRQWLIQSRPDSTVPETKYEKLQGNRLIGLLDIEYEPQLVNLNWRFCSAKCRTANQRIQKKAKTEIEDLAAEILSEV